MPARTGAAASFLELISAAGRRFSAANRWDQREDLERPGLEGSLRALTLEQSRRVQQTSEVLSQAAKILGSVAAVDAWVARKAIGLDNKTPLEMMMTAEGSLALRDHLIRIEYGVYS